MNICIGIVTYNNPKKELEGFFKRLSVAINELDRQDSARVLVIDNGDQQNFDNFGVAFERLFTNTNIGYTKGFNRILKHAFSTPDCDAVISANPDGYFFFDTLKAIVAFHRNNKTCLIEARQFPEEHPKTYDPISLDAPWASGCCMLISRHVYDKVGLFDEAFFLYMEDVDYSWRAQSFGIPVKICPDALYAHSVINRDPPTKKIIQLFLESGLNLGHKWKSESFVQFCKDQLIAEGIYEKMELIPKPKTKVISHAPPKQVNFDNHFTFSVARWTNG